MTTTNRIQFGRQETKGGGLSTFFSKRFVTSQGQNVSPRKVSIIEETNKLKYVKQATNEESESHGS